LRRFQTYMFLVSSQIDFSHYGLDKMPIAESCKKILTVTPYDAWSIETSLYLQVNSIDTQDDPFQLGSSYRWPMSFFSLDSFSNDVVRPLFLQDMDLGTGQVYLRVSLLLSVEQVLHKRRSYSLLDLFGEFGGVLEVGTILFSFYLGSWAEFQYYLKAIQKLYNVKTKYSDQFAGDSNKFMKKINKIKDRLKDSADLERMSQIRVGKLNTCVQLKIFVKWLFGCLSENPKEAKDSATRYFVIGLSRFERELNIDKILKTLRNVKASTLDKELKANLEIERFNVIEVDSEDLLAAERAKAKDVTKSLKNFFQQRLNISKTNSSP